MVIRRGEIWWAALADPIGSGPGYRRPVVVIQADSFNASQIDTVVVAILTSNPRRGDAPGNVALPARSAGLPRNSFTNVSQLLTVDRSCLTDKAGRLTAPQRRALDEGLRLVLSI